MMLKDHRDIIWNWIKIESNWKFDFILKLEFSIDRNGYLDRTSPQFLESFMIPIADSDSDN